MDKSLERSFTNVNPNDYRVDRVLMVGAKPGKNHYLSPNDRDLLFLAMSYLMEWKIPLTDDLSAFMDHHRVQDEKSIRILNILPTFGGEDFLQTTEKAPVVMLCNIADDVPDIESVAGHPVVYSFLQEAFMSSPDHNDKKKWASKLNETQANIVFVMGSDSFRPAEINDGSFVTLAVNEVISVLIRKSFLTKAETYLCVQDSSLFKMGAAIERGDITFHYDYRTQTVRPAPAFG